MKYGTVSFNLISGKETPTGLGPIASRLLKKAQVGIVLLPCVWLNLPQGRIPVSMIYRRSPDGTRQIIGLEVVEDFPGMTKGGVLWIPEADYEEYAQQIKGFASQLEKATEEIAKLAQRMTGKN